jgi:hypothetical protein
MITLNLQEATGPDPGIEGGRGHFPFERFDQTTPQRIEHG